MKTLTKKWAVIVALISFLGLTACTNIPATDVDNPPGTAKSYVVQLIATSNASKAASIKNTFVSEGYKNTKVNTIVKNGSSIHRVQIGPYGSEADGKRVLAQMKNRYHKNPYVNSAVVKTIYGK